ncbi:MAG: hypothetical protein C4533_05465 [Candidatus Omnitrophota bacterium]|jgi:hypothetical protein|nr:MAG: hypothetical protein C4533_05465 [Candidatus Omnitrophota bacterium]
MPVIKLKPVKVSRKLFKLLERRKLIKTFSPSNKVLNVKPGHGYVDTVYACSEEYGPHKLICVGLNSSKIRLASHPDKEDFILINNIRKSKPLYIVIGLYKHDIIQNKVKSGKLTAKDFIMLNIKHNDIHTCVFTMLEGTVHWEATTKGRGNSPFFFVTEPARLRMDFIDLCEYKVEI